MSISYPMSLPASTGIAEVELLGRSLAAVSESPFTFEQQVYQAAAERWEARIDLVPMERADAETWIAWLLSLSGRYGTFLLGDPKGATARGIATGTPLVNGASQTGKTLDTDGWTTSQTGILKAGDWIQLGSGSSSRLHKVVQDANSDGSGNATLEIWPRLRTSPADNAALTVSSAKGVFRLASNETRWSMRELNYGVSFAAVEAL